MLLADGVSFLDTQYCEEDDTGYLSWDSENEVVHEIVVFLSIQETNNAGQELELRRHHVVLFEYLQGKAQNEIILQEKV